MAQEPAGERKVWMSSGGLVESTIPAELADELGIGGDDHVSIRPFLEGTSIAWRVITGGVDEDRANVRKIKHRKDEFEQTTLRFPTTLSAISGLDDLVVGEDVSGEYGRSEDGFLFRTWPPLRPWMVPAAATTWTSTPTSSSSTSTRRSIC